MAVRRSASINRNELNHFGQQIEFVAVLEILKKIAHLYRQSRKVSSPQFFFKAREFQVCVL